MRRWRPSCGGEPKVKRTLTRTTLQIALLLALAPVRQALAQCEEPTTTAELYDVIDQSHLEFSGLEVDAFRRSTERIREIVPCLSDTVPRYLAAELHRLFGLQAAAVGDRTLMEQAFTAARNLEPEYKFPEAMVPPNSPVMEEYQRIREGSEERESVREPKHGYLRFDGRPGTTRPVNSPTVVQVVHRSGRVLQTAYVLPGEPMPAYEARHRLFGKHAQP